MGLALALLGVSFHVGCLLSLVTLPQASERRVLSHTATQRVLCSCGHSRNYWKHTTHDTFRLMAFRPRGLIRLGQQKRRKKRQEGIGPTPSLHPSSPHPSWMSALTLGWSMTQKNSLERTTGHSILACEGLSHTCLLVLRSCPSTSLN